VTQAPQEIAAGDLGSARQFRREVVEGCRPAVIRGLVADWPVVRAAGRSPQALRDYLVPLDAGQRIEVFFGDPSIGGKYYYQADLKGFNFERRSLTYREALDALVAATEHPAAAQSVYVGSVPTAQCLPGFAADNPMPLLEGDPKPRLWLGTASNVSSHYDTFDNLACVVAGHRRFTLYPPELIERLYPGPIDNTMSGATVSLAASAAQEMRGRFPLFEQIRDRALTVELDAGDALYLPKLWWHQIEATAPLNGLANYWWDAFSFGPDAPHTSMLLAMITIAERPAAERQAWKAFFDHYVFRTRGHPLEHLPAEQHGILGALKPDNYGKLRARIMRLLRGG